MKDYTNMTKDEVVACAKAYEKRALAAEEKLRRINSEKISEHMEAEASADHEARQTEHEPAFPVSVQSWNDHISTKANGMSLRDYFMAQVIGHYMVRCDKSFDAGDRDEAPTLEEYAETAYRIADAMLAERVKEKP